MSPSTVRMAPAPSAKAAEFGEDSAGLLVIPLRVPARDERLRPHAERAERPAEEPEQDERRDEHRLRRRDSSGGRRAKKMTSTSLTMLCDIIATMVGKASRPMIL